MTPDWNDKGEHEVATSGCEMWERVMEWARNGWTMPDNEYLEEAIRSADAELSRLSSLTTRWYLADGTYETLPEEEVTRRRKETAGVLQRAGDVEGIAIELYILDTEPAGTDDIRREMWHGNTWCLKDLYLKRASALVAYLLGDGKG